MNTISEMVWDFAKAFATHAKNGFKPVSPLIFKKRMQTCLDCPDFRDDGRCGICGCVMKVKAGWKTSTCPATPPKWESEK
jgi:hypothetical protein